MDAGFVMMMMASAFVILAANAARRDRAPDDDPQSAERRRKFRAVAVITAALLALAYAALLAMFSLALLFTLTFGNGPRSLLLYLLVPALAAASVLLGWLGLLLLRDKALPGRLARAWSAAVEAFFEPTPEAGKPKPARFDHDLD